MTDVDNLRRWTGDQQGVYEVWYLTWNDPNSGDGYWLRYVTEVPQPGVDRDGLGARGELWFARFDPTRPERTFGIHRAFAPAAAHTTPFQISIGTSELGHDRAIGELEGNGHRVRWDLRWEPAPRTLRLLPDVMYLRGGLGETTVLSPNPRVPLSGVLEIDGEKVRLDRAVVGQTHLWGKKHAYSWAWAHCAELPGAPDAVLELLAVRLQRRGVTLPPLTIVALDLDGEHHRLNQFRHTLVNRATWETGRVEFRASSSRLRIEGELTCTAERLVVAPYLDPDGTDVFCANTEIGDVQLTIWKRDGLRWLEYRRFAAPGRAHFETGSRARPSGVSCEHVRVG